MDRQFLLLNDRWALAYDQLQWIIQRRAGTEWRSVSFIATKKRILYRVLDEKGIKPTPEAERVLRCLPDSFNDWYAELQLMEAAE
jgi:hypothetical protein